MLATVKWLDASEICFAFAATLIWFAPNPQAPVNTSGGRNPRP